MPKTAPARIDRRTLLQAAAYAGVACAGGGLSQLLSAQPKPARALATPRRLITVLNSGGWDVTYTIDPKPGLSQVDVPEGELVRHADIPLWSSPTRPAVDAYFERYAERTAVLNGLQVRSFVHPDCLKRILTGSPSDATPDLCAITAFEHAAALPVPYLALGGQARSGPLSAITGRTGTVNQLSALVDPSARYPIAAPDGQYRRDLLIDASDDEKERVRAYLDASAERLRATRGQRGYNRRRVDDFVESLDRAEALRRFAAENGLGERDYTLDLSVQIPLAVRALRDGLSHSVMMQTDDWDTHQNNARQGDKHNSLFDALTQLVSALDAEQLLDDTVVLVISEMGRTPKLNGEQGKDHWPVTSAMLIGAGIRGGHVYGGTTDALAAGNVDFQTGALAKAGRQVEASHFVAGLLDLVGVDPSGYLPETEAYLPYANG